MSDNNISRSQLDPMYREALFAFIPHVLKNFSSKDHPLTVPQIMDYLYVLTGQAYNRNTFDRYFSDLITMMEIDSDAYHANDMKNALIFTYGGTIHEIKNEKTDRNYGNLYYFEPFFSESDINMLCASVISNRYLTESEKQYLNLRLKTMTPFSSDTTLFERSRSTGSERPLLNIIRTLDNAIHDKKQVIVIYGMYDYDDTKMSLDHMNLTERVDNPYHINPYALCWNNGSYYLVCTKVGKTRVYHLRVDRIIDVSSNNLKREKIPSHIKSFFKKDVFDVQRYTKTHPYMGIYGDTDRVNAIFELPSSALSILVDYFGTDIRINRINDNVSNRKDNHYKILHAEISDVEYSCLLLFTIQHHHAMKVLSPPRLINDLKQSLKHSIKQYE